MKLVWKLALTGITAFVFAIFALLLSPQPSLANHGACPDDGDWGIRSGISSHPGGLVVITQLENGTRVDVGFTLSTVDTGAGDIAGYSIVRNDTSFNSVQFISSGSFGTGSTFNCGSPSDAYTGVAVFGFGSSLSNGIRWTLWCQEVYNTSGNFFWNDEEFKITNVAAYAGRNGYWTGSLAGWDTGFTVRNGLTTRITLTWHDVPLTGTIQGYKVVMPGNVNPGPNFPAGETIFLDGNAITSTNPYFLTNVSAGWHNVRVNDPSSLGWSVGWTACTNFKDCHNGTPTPGNSLGVNVPAGGWVDLWWHYTPPQTGQILGRIWKDDNGNGVPDAGEKYIRDPDSTVPDSNCTNYEKVNGSSVNFAGPSNGSVQPVLCNSEPYYSTGQILAGNYSVKVVPPPGWIVTGVAKPGDWTTNADKSASGPLPGGGDRHIWFGIGKLPTCVLTADPATITAGESTVVAWTTTDATGATLGAEGGIKVDVTRWLPSASNTFAASETITLIMTVTNVIGSNSCSAQITVLEAPSPTPGPTPPPSPPSSPPSSPSPQPSPETIALIPNQCENAVETDKLTDNYITKPGTYDSPIEAGGVQLTGTLNQEVTIPLNVKFTVDFSKLQSLFGYPNSDYLEGRFQQGSHRDANILELESADFNNFHGVAQKAEPRYLSDLEKVKYVQYVYKKTSLPESAGVYTDSYGQNPMTIAQMVKEFGTPDPPQSGDRTAWLSGWGRYWPKIPTAYNELYKGKLEFAVIGSETSFEDLKNGNGCASASARTVEFIVPDFGRTTLVADQLNQVIVPYAAQSFRDHRTQDQGVGLGPPKNFLAKAFDFCKKIITAPVNLVRGLQKVIKVSLNFFSPVKTVYAQDSDDGPTCIKILRPGKEGNAPYCAVPPNQLQPGDSCANKITPNKLNPDNPNVVCTFQVGSFTTTIGPANPFWDECRDNGDGTYTCTVNKIRVYPNFRLPWIAEIWNSTLYSDANEAGLGSVQGAKTDEKGQVLQSQTSTGIGSPQVTGRPGIYAAFIPKVLYQKFQEDKNAELLRLFEACPNFPSADGGDLEACGKLATAFITCLNINVANPFEWTALAGKNPQELVDAMRDCIADQVGRNLSGETADSSVQGIKTGGGGQVLASTTGESDAKERFVGAVDCGKHYARDVALKPKALQTYLGIGVTCNLEAAAIPAVEIPPGGGETPPPTDCTPATDGNPLNGIETSREELQCYIIQIASNDVDPMSGDNLADLMRRMMQTESGGGRQCAVGGADEIGVFQYTAGTWKGALGAIINPPVDSGSGTLAQDNAGRSVCWGLPGGDPNLNTSDSWFSWPLNFGQNKDGDAWNPFKQIAAARAKILDGGACIWTSYSGKNTPDPNDGLHPEQCI